VIPASLTICARQYTITLQSMVGAAGCCDNAGQAITIDSDAHPETQSSVLLHEVIEAISASYNLDLKHHVISTLETALYSVLVTNGWWG